MNFIHIKYKVSKILKMPPHKVLQIICSKTAVKITDKIKEHADTKKDTHVKSSFKCLYSYINPNMLDVTKIDLKTAYFFLDMYLNHYFDILGSSYVKVSYSIDPPGVEGIKYDMANKIYSFDEEGEWLNKIVLSPHVNYSKVLWKMIDKNYKPVNWHIDFKSGFCYTAKNWYKNQPVGVFKGADVKVPWELSRMQQLPRIAVFSLICPDKKNDIIREFKNEVLDFCMANPVRMGINWTCTMDAAIRASNMLIAFDILHKIDDLSILDSEFINFFINFIYEHGDFIIHNLEWENGRCGNHYLSDICGLLFISAYIERNETTDAWLAFSIQELIYCMDNQFSEDGTNFEGSTSYHRLSGEFMIYSTALVYGLLNTDKKYGLYEYNYKKIKRLLPLYKQKFKPGSYNFYMESYLLKLFNSGLFTKDITKPNGNITQIGDNDSGRFFKFSPAGNFKSINELNDKYKSVKYKNIEGYKELFDENILNHLTFISAVDGLFNYEKFKCAASEYPLENSIIKSLSGNYQAKINFDIKSNSEIKAVNMSKKNLSYNKLSIIKFNEYIDKCICTDDIKVIVYQDFGMYIFKLEEFYLSVYAGNFDKKINCSHSHNDKLSFEFNLLGHDIFVDPGTYLYTPIPEIRDKFRSVKVHNTVVTVEDYEQNKFIDLFTVLCDTKCSLLNLCSNSIEIELTYRNTCIRRKITLKNQSIYIEDSCNKDFALNFNNLIYTEGYGKLVNRYI